jgi:hypothetical protein
MSTDLFNAVGDICRTAYGIKGEKPAAKAAPADLKSYEYDDIGLGWCIHCGYTIEWDDGRADVWIHTLDLNTGQHLIPLTLTDIPGADLKGIEAVIADVEEGEAYEAARHLAESRNDDGDYSLDAQRDRLAAKEPTESQP